MKRRLFGLPITFVTKASRPHPKEEMFLVDAGLGTARMSMQDEPKGVPINRATSCSESRFSDEITFHERGKVTWDSHYDQHVAWGFISTNDKIGSVRRGTKNGAIDLVQ
ncbi:hypothetical protein L6452_02699 [Arctium lappa]|uniref:Uncharacterized protein n=1 Tax=Arctium lappa TaxID=4217 RepID=A0ACB9FJM8_ARCLA|nr:hypothetical protein L6452_02699 [Arctium lappa]